MWKCSFLIIQILLVASDIFSFKSLLKDYLASKIIPKHLLAYLDDNFKLLTVRIGNVLEFFL